MTPSSLGIEEIARRLHGPGLVIRTGPFTFRIQSQIPSVAAGLALLYADYPLPDASEFVDFEVHLERGAGRPPTRSKRFGSS